MEYLGRNVHLREDPSGLLADACSIIVVAVNYYHAARPVNDGVPRGRIARYAWGRDYHDVLRRRLRELADALRRELREPFETRICVDTAPILEREIAAAAGIGWIGKNTLVLHAALGSFFFLGEIITTLDLEPDSPIEDRCGSCTRCLDACPTRALVSPHVMDARRCIAYLTIEYRGEIARELRPAIGEWACGCDVCQEVCPFNRCPPESREPAFAVRDPAPAVDPGAVLRWSDSDCERILEGSAMRRATPAMLRRNAKIVRENLAARGSGLGAADIP